MRTSRFFQYSAERQRIFLKRQEGLPSPWTTDPILHKHRFTNIFREDDRVTIWFRQNVREAGELDTASHIFRAIAFRWFNRPETWQTLLSHYGDNDEIMRVCSNEEILDTLRRNGAPPWITGAYIILGERGVDKLEGVIRCITLFKEKHLPTLAAMVDQRRKINDPITLRELWKELLKVPYLGPFMAYEAVTDLYYTPVLQDAPDVMTWANAGPGAKRGCNRLLDLPHGRAISQTQCCSIMRMLVKESFDWGWGQRVDWPAWTMREAEHTLCEWDKYERVLNGQGRPRGVYHREPLVVG
jgi:hypothetical protein